jgi:hypothetical protein
VQARMACDVDGGHLISFARFMNYSTSKEIRPHS